MSARVRKWLGREWKYQADKFGVNNEVADEWTRTFGGKDDRWRQQLDMYYHRAIVLGLDNPLGRQALAKFTATAVALTEYSMHLYGELPPAGQSSGNTQE